MMSSQDNEFNEIISTSATETLCLFIAHALNLWLQKGKQNDGTVSMTAHKQKQHHHKKKEGEQQSPGIGQSSSPEKTTSRKLEIVLKCDTSGCIEAIKNALGPLSQPGIEMSLIHTGVGAISQSDIFLAETGSRLVIGFNVGIPPHIEQTLAEHNVEVRIYDVIYNLQEDLKNIAHSFIQHASGEKIIGSARVITLFKSSRKGVILGCDVLQGRLAIGDSFRVVSAMGPIYTGKIDSLHIEKNAVREAGKGQQVGLKLHDFKNVAVGDLVESYRPATDEGVRPWQPQGKIFYT